MRSNVLKYMIRIEIEEVKTLLNQEIMIVIIWDIEMNMTWENTADR